jgi:hypothetical protein
VIEKTRCPPGFSRADRALVVTDSREVVISTMFATASVTLPWRVRENASMLVCS